MISQTKLQELIQQNQVELDKITKVLDADPELGKKQYPYAADAEYTYSHELTRLVAVKMTLKKVNNSHH